MQTIRNIQFHADSREELLPDYAPDFPYISTRAEIDCYPGRSVPWHWHRAVELFYMEEGTLEYDVPGMHLVFPAGSGGFVNSNVLHMTRAQESCSSVVALVHLFDPCLIAGQSGGRIEQRYVLPFISSPALPILALRPDTPTQAALLQMIRSAFEIREDDGYELRIRSALSGIWLSLISELQERPAHPVFPHGADDKIKRLLVYIYEHYSERISIADLAAAAFLSERECFRIFRDHLHTSPAGYIRDYRIRMACGALLRTSDSIASIGYACGLGSSSHFGKLFRDVMGLSPSEYRAKWQNSDNIRR